MKTITSALFVVIVCICNVCNAQTEHLAKVRSVQGIAVYIRCEPMEPYKTFAFYKPKSVWNEKESWMIPNMVKQIREKFPETEGIIFIDNTDLKECELIKFTKE